VTWPLAAVMRTSSPVPNAVAQTVPSAAATRNGTSIPFTSRSTLPLRIRATPEAPAWATQTLPSASAARPTGPFPTATTVPGSAVDEVDAPAARPAGVVVTAPASVPPPDPGAPHPAQATHTRTARASRRMTGR
jgi:hypothetical protein